MVINMAIRVSISDEDRDELTKDLDDFDKAYIEKMKEDGVNPEFMQMFRDISLELHQDEEE